MTEIKFRLSHIIVTTYETEERSLSLADPETFTLSIDIISEL